MEKVQNAIVGKTASDLFIFDFNFNFTCLALCFHNITSQTATRTAGR